MPFLAETHVSVPNKDLLSWTFDDLAYDWDDPIYIDALNPKKSVSARDAKTAIRQLVAGFRSLGIKKGDCVCIHSFNSIWYPIFFLGIIAAGGVFTGTNPGYTPAELAHTLTIARVKLVVVQPVLVDSVKAAYEKVGLSPDRIIIFNPYGEPAPSGFRQWKDLLSHGEQDWVRFNNQQTSQETLAALCFSSGTTGLPKAVRLSHYNFVAYYTAMYEVNRRDWVVKRCFAYPMFHAATVPVAHTTPLKSGHKGYVIPRFDLEQWFRIHEEFQLNEMALLPPVVILAINSPLKNKYSLKSARLGMVGAAPLDRAPQARMAELLGGAPLTQVWGMTEATCVATRFDWDEHDKTGSVGRPIANLDMKIVDDCGKDITGYGVRGELCLRGPTVTEGYFENAEANSRDWDSEGFFHTGDIGYCDGDTKLWYIVDRKKELIKVRAFQVAPAELEGTLLTHADIVDAAVVGIPDAANEASELPRAYLVVRAGASRPQHSHLHAYMRERLSAYKMLTGGIVFVDAIPKNASGKILKRLLREQAKREAGAKL